MRSITCYKILLPSWLREFQGGSLIMGIAVKVSRRSNRSINLRPLFGAVLLSCVMWGAIETAQSAEARVHTLTLSSYLPPTHQQSAVTLKQWVAELENRSEGRLKIRFFTSEQMGKAAEQYHLARRGDADIAFMIHSLPAGRFPLMELTHLPFLFRSAEQASQVLMDLLPEFLVEEHEDVRVLYLIAHAPGHLHTRSSRVTEPADLRRLRVRHPSAVAGELLRAWGASPAGMSPAQIAENVERGVIDGLLIPYDGVYGFRLGQYLEYTTELSAYINTFALVMNKLSYEALPADLRLIIDETTGKIAAREIGRRWDESEVAGRDYMIANGVEIVQLTDQEREVFAEAAETLIRERVERAEAMGLPGRAFISKLRELARKY